MTEASDKEMRAVQGIMEKLKNALWASKELLGDRYEQTVLEMVEGLLPKEIVAEYEDSWISVLDFEEEEVTAEGRIKLDIPGYLDDIFVMTKEDVGDESFAFVVWMKPNKSEIT
jgi:hypothetical protein